MRLERFFYRVVVGVSAALILYGIVLAGTMIYSARQEQAPAGDADFQALVAEQQGEDEPLPQMHPVPEFVGNPNDQLTQDMNELAEETKDDLRLPVFDSEVESRGSEKELVPEHE